MSDDPALAALAEALSSTGLISRLLTYFEGFAKHERIKVYPDTGEELADTWGGSILAALRAAGWTVAARRALDRLAEVERAHAQCMEANGGLSEQHSAHSVEREQYRQALATEEALARRLALAASGFMVAIDAASEGRPWKAEAGRNLDDALAAYRGRHPEEEV